MGVPAADCPQARLRGVSPAPPGETACSCGRLPSSPALGRLCCSPSRRLPPGPGFWPNGPGCRFSRVRCAPYGGLAEGAVIAVKWTAGAVNPGGHARVGFVFEPSQWHGEPANCEPAKCSELVWASPDAPPADTVPYAAAILHAVSRGDTFALNGW